MRPEDGEVWELSFPNGRAIVALLPREKRARRGAAPGAHAGVARGGRLLARADGGTLTFRGNGEVHVKHDNWFIGAWAGTFAGQFPLWEALET